MLLRGLSYRDIVFCIILTLSILTLSACEPRLPRETSEKEISKPNFVLIIADDISWDDIGAYGHTGIHTPNLDKMAQKGMVFNNAFLTASSCSPSRASIITGRYPHNTDAEELHWPLPAEQTTFSEKLKENGYWTVASGKWHLGPQVVDRFDLVDEIAYAAPDNASGGDTWPRLIKEAPEDRPFFMWFASWDAHRPFPEGELPHKHTEADLRIPVYYPETEMMKRNFLDYYDEIARFDMLVGNVVEALEDKGVADNTLILVMADNGRPYARDKTTMYDSGMKTPFIAYWPDQISQGAQSEALLSAIDIAPTILHLSGTDIPETVEGKSFHELFHSPEAAFREYAFSEKNWHDFTDHGRTVRSKDYRYIRNNYTDLPATPTADTVYDPIWEERVAMYEKGELTPLQQIPFIAPRPAEELYDLRSDPLQLSNLALNPDYQDVLVKYRQVLDNWMEETGDFIPTIRSLDEFDRSTGEYTPNRQRPRPSKMDMYGKHGAY
ncbi:sulfatase [Hirschia litorea]|uniref:Sulfatase n=1 Tax=Hirschia litorea TaxID=1199156 RepID=A0ABW2IMP1_9PROT